MSADVQRLFPQVERPFRLLHVYPCHPVRQSAPSDNCTDRLNVVAACHVHQHTLPDNDVMELHGI